MQDQSLDYNPHNQLLAEMERLCFESPWSASTYADLRQNPAIKAWSLTDDAGAPLGFICYQLVAREAEIFRLGIIPARQREGWGRKLLHRFLGFASDKGVGKIFLEVLLENLPAIELYQNAGFQYVSRRNGYFQNPPGDGLVFEKILPATKGD